LGGGRCERRLDFGEVEAAQMEVPVDLDQIVLGNPEEEMAIIDQLEEYERQEKALSEDAEIEQQVGMP